MKKSFSITFEVKRKSLAPVSGGPDFAMPPPDFSTPPPPVKVSRLSSYLTNRRRPDNSDESDTSSANLNVISSPNLGAISPSIFSPSPAKSPRLTFKTKVNERNWLLSVWWTLLEPFLQPVWLLTVLGRGRVQNLQQWAVWSLPSAYLNTGNWNIVSLPGLRINITVMRIRNLAFHLNTDPGPALHSNGDPYPAPHQSDMNLRSLVYSPPLASRAPLWASVPPLWASTGFPCFFLPVKLLNIDFNADLDPLLRIRIHDPGQFMYNFSNRKEHFTWKAVIHRRDCYSITLQQLHYLHKQQLFNLYVLKQEVIRSFRSIHFACPICRRKHDRHSPGGLFCTYLAPS